MMRRSRVLGTLWLAVVACLLSAANTSAAPTDPFEYQYSFDGSSIPEGIPGTPRAIAVNHATGDILVYNRGVINQYDPSGNPVDFAALGSPTLPVGLEGGSLAVDNTGGPTQGNIYLASGGYGSVHLWSYAADGSPIGGATPNDLSSEFNGWVQGVGVMPDGTLRLVYVSLEGSNPLISIPTNQVGQAIGPGEQISTATQLGPYVFDGLGNLYGRAEKAILGKYPAADHYAYAGETGLPAEEGLAVDPSTNDVYERRGSEVIGIHYSDPLVESTPFVALEHLTGEAPIAFDATGQTLYVVEGNFEKSIISVFHREPPRAPYGLTLGVDEIRSDHAILHAQLRAGDAPASYHFEFGTTTAYGRTTPETSVPFSFAPATGSVALDGLQVNTVYHARLVVTNSIGTTYSPDTTFKTYPLPGSGVDPCANALPRKQTAAQALPDCRAYELVSASDTGGYDVESYLAPGQTPFPGFPLAKDRVLYSTHAGAIPGPWNATNNGSDPYLATRTPSGWRTQYEGLPANLNSATGSFSSALGEADPSLNTLAFAGSGLCSPCFTNGGLETGIPVRLPSGQLVQGMAGSLSGGVPAQAMPEGRVAKYFSGDGRDLLFASKYAFEPGANDDNGSLTVYERDLNAGTTEVVSTDQGGNALTGTVSELDVSANGSRVLVGKKASEDPQGNEYVHPYLHIAGRPGSVDLAPGTTSGVLYAGMTQDGSKAFFTTADQLTGADTDSSADLYEAAVDGSGNLSLELISDQSSDACTPVANSEHAHWNTTTGVADCSAVAISGGGGVAASTGAIYFLSPEQFGGQGTLDQPNLYLATPGDSPHLVATLEPNDPLVLDAVKASATRRTGDFQTTPSGNYAVFTSALPLTGVDYFGFRNVFRYDAASDQLACPSCDSSGTTDSSLAEDVQLAPEGLSLLEDGRVFFTTRFPLILSDANGRKDVYEWSEGKRELISSGTGPFDAGLLTASADGTDVFFFTHQAMAPEEDANGGSMRIYDAREGGGFFKLPQSGPCRAADECRGAGTPAPAPADIKSSGKTTQGNVVSCPKNRVKKRGQCVKRKHATKKHQKKHAKKKGGTKRRAGKTSGKRGGRDA